MKEETVRAAGERRRAAIDRETRAYMGDMLIMLAAPAVMAVYRYGARAFAILVLSALTSVVLEKGGYLLMRRPSELGDFSALVTGLAVGLLMPASAPFWLPVAGCAFAIICARLPFGRARHAPFVPAAAGIAFLTVCWPNLLFTYPAVGVPVAVTGSAQFVQGTSLTAMLQVGNSGAPGLLNFFDVIVGNFPGPMGATCTIALMGSAIYMLLRRPGMIITPAAFLAVCSLASVVFPRVLTGRKASLTIEMASGMLIFAALFFMTDLAATPKKPLARLAYGLTGGIFCMLLRYFGAFEEGVCFAVLLANAVFPPAIKWLGEKTGDASDGQQKPRKKRRLAGGKGELLS